MQGKTRLSRRYAKSVQSPRKWKIHEESYDSSFDFGVLEGTRIPGPLIKRIQGASFVKSRNHGETLIISHHREIHICTHRIICIQCNALQPLSSYSGVQKVCKNVQSQNQHLKTGIGFLCNGVKTGLFHPAKGTLYITNLYHTSNVHQQFDSWQGYGQSN